jgi:predicted TPR repeat methyltransferase
MPSGIDYRDSHKSPDKGVSYARDFEQLNYRRYIWQWEQEVLRDVAARLAAKTGAIDYLDFACGTGLIAGLLEDLVADSHGVDVSESMLNVARQTTRRTTLIEVDITTANPFGERKFDLITAFRFFLNAQPALREQVFDALAGLLKPGGQLVFNVHMNHSCTLARLIRTKRRLLRRDPHGFTTLSRQEVSRLAEGRGLELARTYHRGIVPIVKEASWLPMWTIHPLECLASNLSGLEPWCRYVVYVYQQPPASADEPERASSTP